MKFNLIAILLFCFISASVVGQPINDFISYQKSFPKVNQAYAKRLDSLMQQCEQKNIHWPIQQLYIRSFKADNIIEVWVKDDINRPFKFLKTYNVCAAAGKLGPKRKEGDKQVPEGFYTIDRFNPNSNYHLSLGVSYPNVSDRILSDAVKPGGDIYIHGDCVSVGCLAINDTQIEDLYLLGAIAKNEGQEFIPVHIFPGKFSQSKSKETIAKLGKENPEYVPFLFAMRNAFYYFEKERELPAILVNNKGAYVVQDVEIPVETITLPPTASIALPKINNHIVRKYGQNDIESNVDNHPSYAGGNDKYLAFVKNLSAELASYLSATQTKAYVYVDFIVNADGTVSNVHITKGGNEGMNDLLITRLEQTKDWTPAIKNGKEVNYKMSQTFFIAQ